MSKQAKYLTDDGVKYLVAEIDKLYLKPEQLSAMTKDDIDMLFVRDANKIQSEEGLKTLINRGGQLDVVENVALENKTTREDRIIFYQKANVNFHNNFIEAPSAATSAEPNKNWSALYVEEGADVVFDGNEGGIRVNGSTTTNQDGPFCITNFGGNITIKGGRYIGCGTCVYGYSGKTIIEGGYFEASPSTVDSRPAQTWTLNLLNSAYQDGTASIEVRGGTFVDFDPSHPNTDDAASYVPAGYTVNSKEENGHTIYTVVKQVN